MAARKSTITKVKETVVISATNFADRVKALMPATKPVKKAKTVAKAKAEPVTKTKRKAVVQARKARKAKRR